MKTASVTFLRVNDIVEMTLRIAGKAIIKSSSQESIARELEIQGVRRLTIEDTFSTDLPTTENTLDLAGAVIFSEPLPALKLIAACSALGDISVCPFPERRARPRSEMPTSDAF